MHYQYWYYSVKKCIQCQFIALLYFSFYIIIKVFRLQRKKLLLFYCYSFFYIILLLGSHQLYVLYEFLFNMNTSLYSWIISLFDVFWNLISSTHLLDFYLTGDRLPRSLHRPRNIVVKNSIHLCSVHGNGLHGWNLWNRLGSWKIHMVSCCLAGLGENKDCLQGSGHTSTNEECQWR